MSKVVGIGNLASAVAEILEEYGDAAEQAIREVAPKVAREARKELKATSPMDRKRRHYADGWAVQTQDTRNGISVVVYNRTKPGLTHLLENGHALRNGGRSRAIPHIAPVNAAAQEKFLAEVTAKLEGI